MSLYVETDFVGPSDWGDELGIQRGFVEETATELSRVTRQCQGIVGGQVSTKASLERKSPHRHQSALHHLVQSTVHTILYFYIFGFKTFILCKNHRDNQTLFCQAIYFVLFTAAKD